VSQGWHIVSVDSLTVDICKDENGRYAKQYMYDERTGTVTGCPARALVVTSIMKAIKTRGRVKGVSAARQHAEAMMIEELTYVMEWSEAQYPGHWLSTVNKQASAACLRDTRHLACVAKHGLMRAFLSSGFTLWTRCAIYTSIELCVWWSDIFVPQEQRALWPAGLGHRVGLPPATVHH
jgi:hypothetical protein